MRVWFSGGPLDGYEFDIDGEPPLELFVSLRSGGECPGVVDRGYVATYERIEEDGYREKSRLP